MKMSHFFSCILEAKTLVAKSYSASISQSNFFGIPLTTEILIEIISNGLSSGDTKV